mgnify:CR=1 FL=1
MFDSGSKPAHRARAHARGMRRLPPRTSGRIRQRRAGRPYAANFRLQHKPAAVLRASKLATHPLCTRHAPRSWRHVGWATESTRNGPLVGQQRGPDDPQVGPMGIQWKMRPSLARAPAGHPLGWCTCGPRSFNEGLATAPPHPRCPAARLSNKGQPKRGVRVAGFMLFGARSSAREPALCAPRLRGHGGRV